MKPSDHQQSGAQVNLQKQTVSQLAQRGQLQQARDLCASLCENQPDDPELWFLLGAIYGGLEDYQQAETCCRRAIGLSPHVPMLNFNLAMSLLKQEKITEAISFFEKAISLQPGFAAALRELANAHVMNSEPLKAIIHYQKALELEPDFVTRFNLGNTYRDLERWDEAIECYQQCINLNPDFPDAQKELASALIVQFKYPRAMEVLEKAIAKYPNISDLHYLHAIAYQEQGDSDIALEHYRHVLSLDSDNFNAQSGVAGILGLQGNYTEACELLEQMLRDRPGEPSAVLTYAHFAHKIGKSDQAISIVSDLLESGSVKERTQSKLHFSLAQLFERKHEYDTAFTHYEAGNRLRGAQYNHESYDRMFDALMDIYTREFILSHSGSGIESDKPIFIVGMPRSGTSLAEQILASHPLVFGAGELRNINYLVDRLPETMSASLPYPFCLENITEALLTGLANEYLQELGERSSGEQHVTDKMPLNFIHLGFINLLFPHARIIHCERDPIDVCLSCYCKHFSGEHPYAYSLTDLGHFYRLYQKLMIHWKRVISNPVYELKYENLVLNQEDETRKLLDFCGLDWNEDCLEFHRTARTVSTASHEQVRQPMYTGSIGKWRRYEAHLDPLLTALKLKNLGLS